MSEVGVQSSFTKAGRIKRAELYKKYTLKQTIEAALPAFSLAYISTAPSLFVFSQIDTEFERLKNIPISCMRLLAAGVLIVHYTGQWSFTNSDLCRTLNVSNNTLKNRITDCVKAGLILRVKTGKQGHGRVKPRQVGKRPKPLYFISINGHAVLSEFYDYSLKWFDNLKKELNNTNSQK